MPKNRFLTSDDMTVMDANHISLTNQCDEIWEAMDDYAPLFHIHTWDQVTDKPSFSTVATSGSYSDLINKPSLSAVALSNNYADLSNKPSLSLVATSNDYNDLLNKPSIPSISGFDSRITSLESWRSNKSLSLGSPLATNLTTNYNLVTTLLTNLVGAVNATNVRVNEACTRINSIQTVLTAREITA